MGRAWRSLSQAASDGGAVSTREGSSWKRLEQQNRGWRNSSADRRPSRFTLLSNRAEAKIFKGLLRPERRLRVGRWSPRRKLTHVIESRMNGRKNAHIYSWRRGHDGLELTD